MSQMTLINNIFENNYELKNSFYELISNINEHIYLYLSLVL